MTQDTSETFLFKKSKFAHFRDPSGLLDVVDLSNDSVFSEQIYTDAIPTLENLTISSAAQSVSNINTLADSVSEDTGTAGDSNQSFITRYQRIRLEYIADSSPVAYRPKTASINLKNIIQNYDKFCFFVFSNNASGGYYTPLASSPLTFTIKNGVLLCLTKTTPQNALSIIKTYGSTSDTSHLYLNCYMYSGTYAAGVVSLAGTQTVAGDKTFSGTTTITTADINGGTIDGATIATSDVTVGAGKTLNVSSGTLTTSAAQNKTIMQGASSNIDIGAYDLRAATITADGLTSGRVVFAGTNGVLSNDSDLTFSGSTLTVSDIEITGSLTINDTASATTINSVNVDISDNLIIINDGLGSAANLNDSGILIERGSSGNNAFMGWDESADKFTMGTTTATGTATGNLSITTGTLVANLQGNVTGNVSGTAATVTTAAQSAITSVGTLTGLTVSGATNITGNLTVGGKIIGPVIIEETGGGTAATAGNTGTLIIKHTTNNGVSSITFPSQRNQHSDYGAIEYDEDGGSANTETGTMRIKCCNDGADDVRIATGAGAGTDRMTIAGDGNVGIGTTDPGAKLQVNGSIKLKHTSQVLHDSSGYDKGIMFENPGGTHNYYMGYGYGGFFTIGQYHPTATTVYNEFFRGHGNDIILDPDNSGKVGIGTSSPGAKLEIEDTSPELRITDNRSDYGPAANVVLGKIVFQSKEASLDNNNDPVAAIRAITDNATVAPDCRLEFQTGSNGSISTMMTIDPTGYVGIGTTSPDTKLNLHTTASSGTGNNTVLLISDSAGGHCNGVVMGGGGVGYWGMFQDERNGALANDLQFVTASKAILTGTSSSTVDSGVTTVMSLTSTGNVGIGTNVPKASLEISKTLHDGSNEVSGANTNAQSNTSLPVSTYLWLGGTQTGYNSNKSYFGTAIGQKWSGDCYIQPLSITGTNYYDTLLNPNGGNVGIGVDDAPGAKLHLKGDGDVVLKIEADGDNSGEDDNPLLRLSQDGDQVHLDVGLIGNAGQILSNSVANYAYLNAYSPITTPGLHIATNSVARITILDGGNVGIGTTSPGAKLEVKHADSTVNVKQNILRVTTFNDSATRQMVDIGTSPVSYHSGAIYIKKNDTTSIQLAGNGDSYFDGGNVGIGTTDPWAKLQISGTDTTNVKISNSTSGRACLYLETVNDDANDLFFKQNNGTHWSLSGRASGESYALKFYAYNSGWDTVMTLEKAGNVGIGNSAAYKLNFASKLSSNPAAGVSEAPSYIYTSHSSAEGYGSIVMQPRAWTDGHIIFKTCPENSTTISSGSSGDYVEERMRITASGNVGIGPDSTPDHSLHITGGNARVGNGGGQTTYQTGGDRYLKITGESEKNDATLYFGCCYAVNGAHKTAIIAKNIANWSRSDLHFCLNNNTSSNANDQDATTTHSKMVIRNNGNVEITNNLTVGSLTESSDSRVKKNEQLYDTSNCLYAIKNIPILTYDYEPWFKNETHDYISDPNNLNDPSGGIIINPHSVNLSSTGVIGFFAQDLLNFSATQGIVKKEYAKFTDASDNILEFNDFHRVSKTRLISVLMGAVQEQQKIIDEDKSEIIELKTKVSTLETQLADVLSRLSALEAN